MTHVLSRLGTKYRSIGFRRTAGYFFFTIILERIGFRLNRTFLRQMERRRTKAIPVGFGVKLARRLDDLSQRDYATLRAYGGVKLVEQFRSAFAAGKVCIVLRSPNDELATVCWVERVASFPPGMTTPCALVSRCFTLPQFRGRGLYTAALRTVDELLPEEMIRLTTIAIECSAFNYSSRRGILNAGFRNCGLAIEIGRMRFVWQKNS